MTAVLLPCAALAQAPGASAPRPHPADPQAATAALQHRPALASYRRGEAPPPLAWRDANERVERIGGWRAYAREANAPQAPASAPPSR